MPKELKPVLGEHAEERAQSRAIPADWIQQTLHHPDQILVEDSGHQVLQSLFEKDGQRVLLRLFLNPFVRPPLVKTLYLTSKVEKYWLAP